MEIKPNNFIDYGTRPRRAKWILPCLIACLILLAGALYTRRVAIERWWSLVQLRHQVLTYNVPPGTVLFHQTPSDTDQTVLQSVTMVPGWTTVRYRMDGQLFPLQHANRGDPWIILLHERWTPSGKHRVVDATANVMAGPQDAYLELSVRLFDPGSVLQPGFTALPSYRGNGDRTGGKIPGYSGVVLDVTRLPYGSDFELLPGRPDPVDPSAFLFDLRQGEKTITIKGSIADDDSVSLSRSDGGPLPVRIVPTTQSK